MTATNMCSNFGSKWSSPPFWPIFLSIFVLVIIGVLVILKWCHLTVVVYVCIVIIPFFLDRSIQYLLIKTFLT